LYVAERNVNKNSKIGSPLLAAMRRQGDEFIVPFTHDEISKPFIVVMASINERERQPFVLDSGTNAGLVLFPWATQTHRIKRTGKLFGEKRDARELEKCTLNLVTRWQNQETSEQFSIDIPNPIEIDIPEMFNNYPEARLAGVLGTEAFQFFCNRLDFDKRVWTLYTGDAKPVAALRGKVFSLPLEIASEGNEFMRLSLPVGGKRERRVRFFLDTASTSTALPKAVVEGQGGVLYPDERGQNLTFHGPREVTYALIKELRLGDMVLHDIDIAIQDSSDDCRLGLNFLHRFHVTVDPAAKRLILEERLGYRPRVKGRSGLLLRRQEMAVFVSGIAESPLKMTGDLRVGDRIISIDGHLVTGESPLIIGRLLEGVVGTRASLIVEQPNGSGRREVFFERREYFVSPRPPIQSLK
jgi:hypothetical protein